MEVFIFIVHTIREEFRPSTLKRFNDHVHAIGAVLIRVIPVFVDDCQNPIEIDLTDPGSTVLCFLIITILILVEFARIL